MDKLETLLKCLPVAPFKTHLTEEIDRLRQQLAEYERKSEVDYAVMAGDNALIMGLKNDLATVTKERDELAALLEAAVQDISDWGAYAPEYSQYKWNLNGCIEKYKNALAKVGADKEES